MKCNGMEGITRWNCYKAQLQKKKKKMLNNFYSFSVCWDNKPWEKPLKLTPFNFHTCCCASVKVSVAYRIIKSDPLSRRTPQGGEIVSNRTWTQLGYKRDNDETVTSLCSVLDSKQLLTEAECLQNFRWICLFIIFTHSQNQSSPLL